MWRNPDWLNTVRPSRVDMSRVHYYIHNGLLMLIGYKERPGDGRYHEMLDRIRGSLEQPLGSKLESAFIRFMKAYPNWDGTGDDTLGEAIGLIYKDM